LGQDRARTGARRTVGPDIASHALWIDALALVSEPPGAIPQRSILCPACGYDLRASTDNRCSECGLVIDRESLLRSGIPWASRRQIGRIRAFWRTVWLMTVDAKVLRHETAKPQSVRDAIVFRRWVAVLVVASAAIVTVMFVQTGGLTESIVHRNSAFSGLPRYTADYAVPWSAGVTLSAAIYGFVTLASICIVLAPGAVFRTRGMLPEQAETAQALGAYVTAPLVWLLPAALSFACVIWVDAPGSPVTPIFRVVAILTLVWCVLAIVAVGFTVHRTGQWRARVMRGGYPTGFAAMAELIGRWTVAIGVCLFVVPWCVGLLWLVVDSFRA
jgi:hypothetical protein